MNFNEFLERAILKHGYKYTYNEESFNNRDKANKIDITCKEHGLFKMNIYNHLNGQGCPKCKFEKLSDSFKQSFDEFIRLSRETHGDRYEYNEQEYKGSHSKVIITCKKHGDFEQLAVKHYKGEGCPLCANEEKAKKKVLPFERILEKFKDVHGSKYRYDEATYTKTHEYMKIICPIHGEFWQTPNNHMAGHGCKHCSDSKIEKEVANLLKNKNIKYLYCADYKTFTWLEKQHLDFYLPEYNIAIECQGGQHFREVEHFGGSDGYITTVKRDKKKNRLCNEHGVKLLYYSHEKENTFLEQKLIKDENALLNEIYNNGKKRT